ncbi:hypothetical protein BDB00DRAFT_757835 [Zychaea mexicana]|uniref:uncharacterized protein n=1 Tax=Zychaea mexicana TaxID=64656 RepID=UPI0022FE9C1B|nr:uncharacterized protein BDB00DRAFT_757835 [Zychaea mexicana]KAI9496867.1 hypothetical protein BDB00DRAFT_757835 [Zychaea mexicana]
MSTDNVVEEDDEDEDEDDDMEDYYSKRSLTRLRQNSEDNPRHSVCLENDIIAKFSQESLYSYSFNPAFYRTTKSARTSRKHMIRRGVDLIKRLRYKLDDRVTRRFSHPDIGGAMATYDWQTNYWSAQNTPRTSIDYDNSSNIFREVLATSGSSSSEQPMLPPPTDDVFTVAAENYYRRALHAPTRYLPQNQAIFTTSVDGTILLFNDIASLCFGINKSYVGKTILSVLQQPFRKQVEYLLSHRKDLPVVGTRHGKSSVLVCGNVMPIVKTNGDLSAASLWLKEKERDNGQVVYIWIFEEICESTLSAHLNSKGIITDIVGKMEELFGYQSNHVIGKPIDLLIPQLKTKPTATDIEPAANITLTSLEQWRFFGAQAKSGAFFPVMVTLHPDDDKGHQFSLKITSLPAIAGMITIHTSDGTIQSINPVPAKYLFGYHHVDSISEKMNIDQLLPQFHDILSGLRLDDNKNNSLWLHDGTVISNQTCRKALFLQQQPSSGPLTQDTERKLSVSSLQSGGSNNSTAWLPSIYAKHRDGSHFDVQLQLRSIESAEEDLISIWVSFDRIHSVVRRSNNNKRKATSGSPPATSDDSNIDQDSDTHRQPLTKRILKTRNVRRGLAPLEEIAESAPDPVIPVPEPAPTTTEQQQHQWPPPLPTDGDKHPLDDYVIEATLGEGTYGTAMLAYRKDDETKKRIVIKSITKSRIIVDSWMRDRRVGDIVPAEIHILRTLKQKPHINCCSLSEGVQYLHKNKIVHRDIKDENIILDESGTAVIIDFGSAAYYRENKKFETFCGTMDYWAPELLQGISYDGPPQDIWSLGILLHTLIFRETPFNEIDDILGDELRIRDPPYPGPTELLRKMLSRDVVSRPSIDQVLNDPWLQQ